MKHRASDQESFRPSVVIMSLGVPLSKASEELSKAVRQLAMSSTVVVASGNNAADACGTVPANLENVIVVAASNLPSKWNGPSSLSAFSVDSSTMDNMYSWSNTGTCVSIFAPGVEILGACGGKGRCDDVSDESYAWSSGSSMAAPHVAGLAALVLEMNPTFSPEQVTGARVQVFIPILHLLTLAQVKEVIMREATKDAIVDSRMLVGTTNRFIYTKGSGMV